MLRPVLRALKCLFCVTTVDSPSSSTAEEMCSEQFGGLSKATQ